jgi:hypothetical protein
MKVRMQLQATSKGILPGTVEAHYHCYVGAEVKLVAEPFDAELPDPPPEKSDGQKVYEAYHAGSPALAWATLMCTTRNAWHTAAAAVTGKPPALETEPAPRPTQGERFFRAYLLNTPRLRPRSWSELSQGERDTWTARAMRYEESAP